MILPTKWKKISKFRFDTGTSVGDIAFFRFPIFGHKNDSLNLGALGRLGQAFCLASVVTISVVLIIVFFKSLIHNAAYADYLWLFLRKKMGWPVLSFWGTVFTFVAALEIGSYYQKWRYLSDLFNAVIKIEPKNHWNSLTGEKSYSQREHLLACLAMDVVSMEMWTHRSFFPFLKETIEKAVLVKNGFDEGGTQHELTDLSESCSKETIKDALSTYIDWNRPTLDLISSLNNPNLKAKISSSVETG